MEGKRQLDMLHGSIWDKIPRFALPVAATAILEQLFNASDVAVVGNFTGAGRTAAVAAVGGEQPADRPDRQSVYRHCPWNQCGDRPCDWPGREAGGA